MSENFLVSGNTRGKIGQKEVKGSTKSSRIVLKPTEVDNGSLVRCKASNSEGRGTQDSLKLNVLCKFEIKRTLQEGTIIIIISLALNKSKL